MKKPKIGHRSRGSWLLAGLTVGALALSGCGAGGDSNSSDGKRDPNATLRTTYVTAATLDPAIQEGPNVVLSNTWPVYDRLLQIDEDAKYQPMLATKWDFSPDGKTLTLELRKGVVFSDGAKFDAATVKANIDRYRKSPTTATVSSVIDSVEIVDDHKVNLHLARPTMSVLAALAASAPGIMISPDALDNPDLASKPVGTGAWVIDTFRPGQQTTYKLRPDTENIWDPKTGKIARIDIATRSSEAAYAAIRSGQVDVVLSNGNVDPLQSQIDAKKLVVRPLKNSVTISGMYLNQTVKPFDDVLVRQAVNLAIDRKAIVKTFVPTTTPRVQLLPSAINGFDESLEKTYPFDPAKAKELLAKAGHPDGLDAGSIFVANYQPFPQVAQVVQSNLADVGIKIDIDLFDARQLTTQYGKVNKAAKLDFFGFQALEPGAALKWFLESPIPHPGGVPAEIAEEIAQIDDPTVSREERAKRAGKVNEFALEQAYYAPIYQNNPGWVLTSKVHGIEPGKGFLTPMGVQDFRHAWMSK